MVETEETLISLHSVGKVFHSGHGSVAALSGVSFDIRRGEILGVIGQSGAGKSTLIRCLNYLERPSSGSIEFEGMPLGSLDAAGLRTLRRRMGMIFQDFNLLKTATVYENVALPLRLLGFSKDEVTSRSKRYLDVVGLSDKFEAYPSQLSGGQQQRVAIARAIAHGPEVLLCDEATSALDPENTESILHLIASVNEEFGITVVIVTHEMRVIQAVCDRVAVLSAGELVEMGSLNEVYTDPKHPVTRRLLAGILPREMTAALVDKLGVHGSVYSLIFAGDVAGKPVLAETLRKFKVSANILAANIIELKKEPFGFLVVAFSGEEQEIRGAIAYLERMDVRIKKWGGEHEMA
ncbi:MAG: ATP-binding cassette domain-containing protein [Spirochaetaceae bacterium]|nr:ATP-binding cassette domain-containing protein [Spirochaetaceae bacterium]